MQAINYFVANNYVKALEALAKSPNQKILMMPLEASARDRLAGRARRDHQRSVRQQRCAGAPDAVARAAARQGSVPPAVSVALGSCSALGDARPCRALFGFFASFGAWNWFILAVLLFMLETVVPGVHFLWFGLAAVIVGFLALATGMAWPWQLIAFGVISVLTVFWVRRYVRARDGDQSDLPDLNVRGQQYVGRSLVVEQAIQNGRGKVRVGDTLWPPRAPTRRRARA